MRPRRICFVGVAVVTVIAGCKKSPQAPPELHQAARAGDLRRVQTLIAEGADINARRGSTVCTPLYDAAVNGHREVAALLSANGAAIGREELHAAVEAGATEMLTLFVASGADIKGTQPLSLLHLAVSRGQREIAEFLIAKGIDVNARDSIQAYTALHCAAQNDDPNLVRLLVSAGADVDAIDDESRRPLDLAVLHDRVKALKSLLAQGADPNAIHRRLECTPLMGAILHRRTDIAELLLARGANVNQQGGSGGTPLHAAVLDNDPNVIQFLLARGADIDAKDEDGATPLHKAAQYTNTKTVAALIENGSDVNALTTEGRTPLDYAYETDKNGEYGLVELLRAAGGDTGRNVRKERL